MMTLQQAENEGLERAVRAVRLHKQQNNPEGALKVLEPLIETFDSEIPSRESGVMTFQEPLEREVHKLFSQDERTPPACKVPVNLIFSARGSILIDLKRFDEAAEALYKAVGYNKASAMVIHEFAECFKIAGDMELFEHWTRQAFPVNLHAAQIAKSYRNFGYLLIEKQEYEEAAAFLHLSKLYGDSPAAAHELEYIKSVTGKDYPDPGLEACYELCRKYDLPLGPHGAVRGLLRGRILAFLAAGHPELAEPDAHRMLELHPGADLKHLLEFRTEDNFDPDDQLNYLLNRRK